jgi:hypothetical protein
VTAPALPQRFYATFGVKYSSEPHPTLPRTVAHPDKVIEIYAPSEEIAQRIIIGLTLVDRVACFSAIKRWPATLEGEAEMARYFPLGVSMIIDCREL